MAYSTSNPPRLVWSALTRGPDANSAYSGTAQGASVSGSFEGQGKQCWLYTSTDVSTAVDGKSWITNGYALGMRRGDLVIVQERVSGGATTLTTMHSVNSATATGGVDLADAVAISSVTNSD